MKSTLSKTVAVACASVIAGFAAMSLAIQQERQVRPLRDGNPEQTLAQARVLLDRLREAGWDDMKVDQLLFRVPDQALDSTTYRRASGQRTFAMQKGFPEYAEVAFSTDLYVDVNLRPVQGKEGVTDPKGFFIVAWKHGLVETVPLAKVRMYSTIEARTGELVQIVVFPGMDEYKDDLPKFPGLK